MKSRLCRTMLYEVRRILLRVMVGLGFMLCITSCARPIALHLQDGSTVQLTDHAGQWVLVNYWAEWCEPCRREIPELNALLKARAPTVAVYGVNYDGISGAALQAQAMKMGIAFPLLTSDPGVDLGTAHPEVLPTTIVIAPSGRRTLLVGPQTQASLNAVLSRAN